MSIYKGTTLMPIKAIKLFKQDILASKQGVQRPRKNISSVPEG